MPLGAGTHRVFIFLGEHLVFKHLKGQLISACSLLQGPVSVFSIFLSKCRGFCLNKKCPNTMFIRSFEAPNPTPPLFSILEPLELHHEKNLLENASFQPSLAFYQNHRHKLTHPILSFISFWFENNKIPPHTRWTSLPFNAFRDPRNECQGTDGHLHGFLIHLQLLLLLSCLTSAEGSGWERTRLQPGLFFKASAEMCLVLASCFCTAP